MSLSVVIAPDSFKGSVSASDAASAIAVGWRTVRPDDHLVLAPQADGGEGTIDAIAASVAGTRLHEIGPVTGPDGRPTPGSWLELPGGTAVIELASVGGLPLMRHPDALGATTRGLGEVIAAVLSSGAHSLIIALGGSATTDAGTGALSALGLRLLDAAGSTLPDGGGPLTTLARIDTSRLTPPPPGGVTLLTDVSAPLLGLRGAAAVFGPQKGASSDDVRELEAGLARFARLLGSVPGVDPATPGTGAAGGCGFGFAAVWGARIVPGADYVARLTRLDAAIGTADLVITGEGRFDAQSFLGKSTGHVLALAAAGGVRARVIAGQAERSGAIIDGLASATAFPIELTELAELAGSPQIAMGAPLDWLRAAGALAATGETAR